MQNQNGNQTDNTNPVVVPPSTPTQDAPTQDNAPVQDAPVQNDAATPAPSDDSLSTEAPIDNEPALPPSNSDALMPDVAEKIGNAHNILVALPSNPSVDDFSSAIGLSLFLDRIGKHTTTIYSGTTPNAIDFLRPNETFEASTDTLQDFVIALNKEKADHLRYKLDGDYVKIYITPYRTRISEDDLEFTYGDYNVDLVVAIDVKNSTDLDSALREQGRVMHDATIVNITASQSSKFGNIEWSNQDASSVSEMIAKLLYNMDDHITAEEATALLTGIISATDRFSDDNTTPETMQIASRLMASGADQKLITENITADDLKTNPTNLGSNDKGQDLSSLDIKHEEEKPVSEDNPTPEPEKSDVVEKPDVVENPDTSKEEPTSEEKPAPAPEKTDTSKDNPTPEPPAPEPVLGSNLGSADLVLPEPTNFEAEIKPETNISPNAEFTASLEEGTNKYGQMLEDALNELNDAPANPATSIAPPVPEKPEINGVPEIDFKPMPSGDILPPPPTPPIDNMSNMPPMPDLPPIPPASTTPESVTPSIPAPTVSIPEPTTPTDSASDPSAFKIP